MDEYTDADFLQLSGIQHFAFCRRQWALIHIEQQWAENYQTTSGALMHEKAHDENSVEKRRDLIVMRGLRIASRQLGLSGQCDVVEFHRSRDGIALPGYDGMWCAVPVEYKRGREKEGPEDAVQLCAQAICLEEMLLTTIPKGDLFYGETRRREEIILDAGLRQQVLDLSREMHEYYRRGYTPRVKTGKKCRGCSLKDLCMPKLNRAPDVDRYITDRLGEEALP